MKFDAGKNAELMFSLVESLQLKLGSVIELGGKQFVCVETCSARFTIIAVQSSTEIALGQAKATEHGQSKYIHTEIAEFSNGDPIEIEEESYFLVAINGEPSDWFKIFDKLTYRRYTDGPKRPEVSTS
jgi:hypothetical protein